jgi:hypothetical protein
VKQSGILLLSEKIKTGNSYKSLEGKKDSVMARSKFKHKRNRHKRNLKQKRLKEKRQVEKKD